MAVTIFGTPLSGQTVSTTELSLLNGSSTLTANTTAGCYQLFVDGVANMAKNDEFKIRIYEKVHASGTMRVVFSAVLSDAQSEVFCTPSLLLLNGWQMTIVKVAGTDRAFDASIRKAG